MPLEPYSSVVTQARLIESGSLTSVELVRTCLARIAALNPRLNAFRHVLADEALAEAEHRDGGAVLGPLHGVPIAVKEEQDVAGVVTTLGGDAHDHPATADSELVRRLRAAGAVIIGTTRMPEFGIWPFTESRAGGLTRNPWNPAWSTAGSSGGSAAAVASGMVAAAIGGDGGGSIRLPSSWCGLYGLKPQRGRVSSAPHPDLWRSLGTAGPLTRTVADSALIYDVISSTTDVDRWHAAPVDLPLALEAQFRPLRIAVTHRAPGGPVRPDRESVAALHRAADALHSLGHHVEGFDPQFPFVAPAFLAQLVAGVGDEVARLDRPRDIERRTRHLLGIGRPLARFADRWEPEAIARGDEFNADFFDRFDLLLTHTTPRPATAVGQIDGKGLVRTAVRSLPIASYTSLWNVLGNPAAAVPSGFSADGRPLSVQLVGPPNGDARVVTVSAQLERLRPWAYATPPL